MKTKVFLVLLGVLLSLSLSLVACSGGSSSTTPAPAKTTAPAATTAAPASSAPPATTAKPAPTTSAAPASSPAAGTPKKGGILKIIIGTTSNLGVPWAGNAPNDLFYVNPAIETLLLTDPQGNPTPRLATGWTIAPDFKSLTFTLRKGVKFHDGTDFNAAALKWLLEKYATSPQPELKNVTSVDVVDDYTAKVNFSQYNPAFLSFMAVGKPGWIVSPTAAQKLGDDEMLHHPVGTGPFTFVSFKQDVSVVFTKNPNYWQAGKPYLDGIQYDIIADPVTAVLSLKSGSELVHWNVSPKDGNDLKQAGFNVTAAPASIYQYIPDSANKDSPWSKLKVRQAAQYAIDTVAMAKAQGYGYADPYWNQMFPKGNIAYDPTIVGYPYDPVKAKALLAEAGYASGFKTSLFNSVPPVGDLEPAVQNYLGAVGIQADLKPLAGAAYTQANTQGWTNGMFRSQSVASLGADPLYQMNTYLSTPPKGWYSCDRPQDMQTLLNKANGDLDTTQRTADIKALVKNVIDTNCLVINTWGGYLVSAKDKSVQGDNIRTMWTMTWSPEDTWLNK
jgi:peptide/nickel transport system substrate-binding protein